MKKHLSLGLSAFALAALLSGCGGATSTAPTSAAPAPSSAAASTPMESSGSAAASSTPMTAAELKTAASTAGQIVVDAKGMSVYVFTKDVKGGTTSACTGDCAASWPAVTTTSAAPAVDGVTGTVGTIATPDGKKQMTINGMPLYYFGKDQAAGDILGQGVGGVWYLVTPSGEMIKAAAGGY